VNPLLKPFQELTYRARLRRLRKQAQAAVEAYGLSRARVRVLGYSGNTHYRVDASQSVGLGSDDGPYWRDHYLLRLHQPHYQTRAAIESELLWLQALLHDTKLVVPQPVTNLDGELVTVTAIPGLPAPQYATLLRWVKGRKSSGEPTAKQYRALGRVAAQLHNHASHWQPPERFTRIHYDWNGLFGDGGLFEFPASRLWELIPKSYRRSFEAVTRQVRDVMNELGKGPDVYGLIHADLAVDANVLWHRGEPCIIDFDDSAHGYWIYDLAIALADVQNDETLRRFQVALLEGYSELRSMPPSQWAHLGLFIAAWHATAMLYAINGWLANPMFRAGAIRWRDQEGKGLIRAAGRLRA
jgi:Ser/Thr protein kinase RdoA (MazF antagonist)